MSLPGSKTVNLSDIEVGPQMRKKFRKIENLAGSIEANGLINAVEVKEIGGGKFMLITGERRYRAFQFLRNKALEGNTQSKEWLQIPVMVRSGSAKELERRQVHENLHQNQPTSQEYYEVVNDKRKAGLSISDIAQDLSITSSWVSQLLSINNASDGVKDELKSGGLTAGKAIVMGKSGLSEEVQDSLVEEAKGMSEEALKDTVEHVKQQENSPKKKSNAGRKPFRYSFPKVSVVSDAIDDLYDQANKAGGDDLEQAYKKGLNDALSKIVIIRDVPSKS